MTTQGKTATPLPVLVEFGVGYALILAAIWTLNPWQRVFYWGAIVWVVVTTWIHRPTWRELGLGLPGVVRSLWVVGIAGTLAGLGRLRGRPDAFASTPYTVLRRCCLTSGGT